MPCLLLQTWRHRKEKRKPININGKEHSDLSARRERRHHCKSTGQQAHNHVELYCGIRIDYRRTGMDSHRQAGSNKADEIIAKADAASTDSVAVELYKEAADAGYKSGHRAAAEVAIRLYQDGKYEEAIKYLDKANLDDEVAAAGVYTLKGDCYVNLDKLDKAMDCYSKAESKADENPEIVPLILIKEANIYRAQEKYADEAKCYKEIIDEYPLYVQQSRTDIRKYYERALAQSKN